MTQHLPDYWEDATSTLKNSDPVLGNIIDTYAGETLQGKGDPFLTLARAIVGQQISVKAADSVWKKLEGGYTRSSAAQAHAERSARPGRAVREQKATSADVASPEPVSYEMQEAFHGDLLREYILLEEEDGMRAHGLSRQKITYLKDLARYFTEEKPVIAHWQDMSDEELIASLTSIRGIGRWTAEMFLIFHLLRADVFPVDDIGLQKAVWKHYFDGEKQPLKTLRAQGENWRPYRSVATWYLWRSLDPVPVEY